MILLLWVGWVWVRWVISNVVWIWFRCVVLLGLVGNCSIDVLCLKVLVLVILKIFVV